MEKKKENYLLAAFKGLIVGASMLLPGVSGGTMAIILGLYEKLIHSISVLTELLKLIWDKFLNLFRTEKKTRKLNKQELKQSALLLVLFSVGAGIGMLLFARLIQSAITYFKVPMHYFFMGAILGGVPTLFHKSKISVSKIKVTEILAAVAGFLIVYAISLLPSGLFVFESLNVLSFVVLIVAGIVIAVALILPGISTSQMLLLLGIYELVLNSLANYQFLVLVPLVVGVVVGTVLTTNSLERAMQKYPRITYMFIIGFVLGSILDVFPGVPQGIEILFSVLLLIAGFVAIYFVSKISNRE